MTFFVKNSKYLSKCHTNLFPKSRFSKYINPWLVILFCEVQNQNKQKCASRYLYQNNNKRLHFLAQISPKSFLKISVYLVKNVKSGKTFICWEPYNKLGGHCRDILRHFGTFSGHRDNYCTIFSLFSSLCGYLSAASLSSVTERSHARAGLIFFRRNKKLPKPWRWIY